MAPTKWTAEHKDYLCTLHERAKSHPFKDRLNFVIAEFNVRYPDFAADKSKRSFQTALNKAVRAAEGLDGERKAREAQREANRVAGRESRAAWADLEALRDLHEKRALRAPASSSSASSSAAASSLQAPPSAFRAYHNWTKGQEDDLADIINRVAEENGHRQELVLDWLAVERRFAYVHPMVKASSGKLKSKWADMKTFDRRNSASSGPLPPPKFEQQRLARLAEEGEEDDGEESGSDDLEIGAKFQPWTRDEQHELTRAIKRHKDQPQQARFKGIHDDFFAAFPKSERTWAAVRLKIEQMDMNPEQLKVIEARQKESKAKSAGRARLAATRGAAVPMGEGSREEEEESGDEWDSGEDDE